MALRVRRPQRHLDANIEEQQTTLKDEYVTATCVMRFCVKF